jgi:glycosyltransferase involved in cell wall biosynthesis
VDVVTWPLPRPALPPSPSTTAPDARVRGWWLPASARLSLRSAYYRSRRWVKRSRTRSRKLINSFRDRSRQDSSTHQRPLLPYLTDSALVVAESFHVAKIALRNGLPRHRLLALCLPSEPHYDKTSKEAIEIARLAEVVGGFLTDSDLAREAIERAASSARPLVLLYPPLAVDRECSQCFGQASPQEDLTDTDTQPVMLNEWRRLFEKSREGRVEETLSFVAARAVGQSGRPWKTVAQLGWWDGPSNLAHRTFDNGEAAWSVDAQRYMAKAIICKMGAGVGDQEAALQGARSPRRALVSGYDLKFVRELADRLNRRTDLEVVVDEWPYLSRGNEETQSLAENAQSILAEWARPNAVVLSQLKKVDQFLVVRLHRFEIESEYPRQIAMDNVDAVVYIAPHMGRRISGELGWPVDKLLYIPNFIDLDWLTRPKLSGAQFCLGIVGVLPMLKRLDLALDLLSRVRQEDPRFALLVRSALPWENRYVWEDAQQREYFGWCLQRIERDPALRGAVTFDVAGRDMARWYRRIGHILSTSDVEGSHTAVAEGMASGSVPVVRPWAGARELYGNEWLHNSIDDAAKSILKCSDVEVWKERSVAARAEVRRTHDTQTIVRAWADLLHGDLEGARTHFVAQTQL